MIYAVADIHGCYEEFLQLLEKINFTDDDEMYILGDMVDKGPDPIKLVQDLMMRPNVYPILGNHDFAVITVLRKFNTEITEDNVESHLTAEDMQSYMHWLADGGPTTAKQFTQLDKEGREEVLEYLEECALYEEVEAGGRKYVLVHAGLNNFHPDKDLDQYHFSDLTLYRPDYTQRYYEDKYVVTGHTPTFKIREDGKPLVYEDHGNIAIDCGCIYGLKLAAYCLDTHQAFYVDSLQPPRKKKEKK